MRDINIHWKGYPHNLPRIRFCRRHRHRRRPDRSWGKSIPIASIDGAASSREAREPKSYALKVVADVPVYWTNGSRNPSFDPDRGRINSIRDYGPGPVLIGPSDGALEQELDFTSKSRAIEPTYDPRSVHRPQVKTVHSVKSTATQLGPFRPNVVRYHESRVGRASVKSSRQSLRSIVPLSSRSRSRSRKSGAPSLQSIIKSILSDVPSRSSSQQRAIDKFTRDLALYARKTQWPAKGGPITSTTSTTISANTVRNLEPYRTQFLSAGLAVTSKEQRGMMKPTKSLTRTLPGRNDVIYRHNQIPQSQLWSNKRVKNPKAIQKYKQASSTSDSTGTTVIGFTPPHDKSYPRAYRPRKAPSLSSDHTIVGFTPPDERFAPRIPIDRTTIGASRMRERSPPQALPRLRDQVFVKALRQKNSFPTQLTIQNSRPNIDPLHSQVGLQVQPLHIPSEKAVNRPVRQKQYGRKPSSQSYDTRMVVPSYEDSFVKVPFHFPREDISMAATQPSPGPIRQSAPSLSNRKNIVSIIRKQETSTQSSSAIVRSNNVVGVVPPSSLFFQRSSSRNRDKLVVASRPQEERGAPVLSTRLDDDVVLDIAHPTHVTVSKSPRLPQHNLTSATRASALPLHPLDERPSTRKSLPWLRKPAAYVVTPHTSDTGLVSNNAHVMKYEYSRRTDINDINNRVYYPAGMEDWVSPHEGRVMFGIDQNHEHSLSLLDPAVTEAPRYNRDLRSTNIKSAEGNIGPGNRATRERNHTFDQGTRHPSIHDNPQDIENSKKRDMIKHTLNRVQSNTFQESTSTLKRGNRGYDWVEAAQHQRVAPDLDYQSNNTRKEGVGRLGTAYGPVVDSALANTLQMPRDQTGYTTVVPPQSQNTAYLLASNSQRNDPSLLLPEPEVEVPELRTHTPTVWQPFPYLGRTTVQVSEGQLPTKEPSNDARMSKKPDPLDTTIPEYPQVLHVKPQDQISSYELRNNRRTYPVPHMNGKRLVTTNVAEQYQEPLQAAADVSGDKPRYKQAKYVQVLTPDNNFTDPAMPTQPEPLMFETAARPLDEWPQIGGVVDTPALAARSEPQDTISWTRPASRSGHSTDLVAEDQLEVKDIQEVHGTDRKSRVPMVTNTTVPALNISRLPEKRHVVPDRLEQSRDPLSTHSSHLKVEQSISTDASVPRPLPVYRKRLMVAGERSRLLWTRDAPAVDTGHQDPVNASTGPLSPPPTPHQHDQLFHPSRTQTPAPRNIEGPSEFLVMQNDDSSLAPLEHMCTASSLRCQQCYPSRCVSPEDSMIQPSLSKQAVYEQQEVDVISAIQTSLSPEKRRNKTTQTSATLQSFQEFFGASPIADPEKRPSLPQILDRSLGDLEANITGENTGGATKPLETLPSYGKLQQPLLNRDIPPRLVQLIPTSNYLDSTAQPLLGRRSSASTTTEGRDNKGGKTYDRKVFQGLHVATAAASDEDIDGWIEEVAGVSIRMFLADLSVFEGLGVNTLANIAKRASKERRSRIQAWETVRRDRLQTGGTWQRGDRDDEGKKMGDHGGRVVK